MVEQSHVTYLWDSNLKSRASFLMILDFLPVHRKKYIDLMALLSPGYSSEFFEAYIKHSY